MLHAWYILVMKPQSGLGAISQLKTFFSLKKKQIKDFEVVVLSGHLVMQIINCKISSSINHHPCVN
jgi:hypothetical protein